MLKGWKDSVIDLVEIIQMLIQAISFGAATILIPFLILFFLTSGNYLFSVAISFLITIAFGIFFITFYNNIGKRTKNCIQRYNEHNSQDSHHAIIIALRNPYDNLKIRPYMDGMDILIKTFREREKQINYKVYEINSKNEAIKIICDPKATHLWIFGHGARNKLRFDSGNLYYDEVRAADKKDFIGQYHCNSLFGKSLADYNNPLHQDVSRWPRMTPFIRFSVINKLIELGLYKN